MFTNVLQYAKYKKEGRICEICGKLKFDCTCFWESTTKKVKQK